MFFAYTLHEKIEKIIYIFMFNKKNVILFIISLTIWLFPFLLRLYNTETSVLEMNNNIQQENIASQVIASFDREDYLSAFLLIFKNNIYGCIFNILGGVLLGIGTLWNLMLNGFMSADMFSNAHMAGLSINTIVKITLPHSFELIAFWLSGAIGLSIAWKLIQFMLGNDVFALRFYKKIGLWSIIVFITILCAAFAEAYISVKMIM